MRLFLFLVGGTGSRVMRPLIMQLAAGVHPLDENNNPIPLEIIPIIVDPHKSNEDLKRTENLLRWYKQIRSTLYGDQVDVKRGFFSVKISQLSDILPNNQEMTDTFLFNLSSIESKKFKDFISYNTLDAANQALFSMLFSNEQLETKMDIGFVGSPNIGCVALNQFKDSQEFKLFANVFDKNDRIFIVSSIFGGTGAAGYPIIVKNIRNAPYNQTLSNKGNLRDAQIGALTVLPYFNVQQDPKSPINYSDFISKTKSALYYYHDNLTGIRKDGQDTGTSKINACYYLGDKILSYPYNNDPGQNGQRNDAHVVEYVGALSILDFLQIPSEQLKTVDGIAVNPIFKEYGLSNEASPLTLKDLGLETKVFINKQMIKFHLAYMYFTNSFEKDLGRGFTQDKPEITKAFKSTTFYGLLKNNFFIAYTKWLNEMRHNTRSFEPYDIETEKISHCIKGIAAKSSLFKSAIDYKGILSALNKMSQKQNKAKSYQQGQEAFKLMDLLERTLDEVVDERLEDIL